MEMVGGRTLSPKAGRRRPAAVVAVAAFALCAGSIQREAWPSKSKPQETQKSGTNRMSITFERAAEASGGEFLQLELDLRASSQLDRTESERLRKAALSHVDPVGRLLARVILDWAGPREKDFKSALDYLEQAPIKLAPTAAGLPSAMGIEGYLTLHFADRVAELLAVRLVKEDGWPQWKVVGIIFYLKAHKVLSTTSALIRFAIETQEAEWRRFALQTIREINDPKLGPKLAFEIARAKKLKRPLPVDVKTLAG
jgi:hypothetical protein